MDIRKNIEQVRSRIERASTACGRSSREILLLPVTKTFPTAAIAGAMDAGLRTFAENRVQEAEPKIEHFRSLSPDISWHLVGHLQSNKARRAVQLFDVIHSLDSLRLAQKLSQAAVELQKNVSVLLQVDLGQEATKFGCARAEAPALIEALAELPGLTLDGLMTLPPYFEDPEKTRPYFRTLREFRDEINSRTPGRLGRMHLSMGMTHDFEVAITEGATIVRIGTAIFGSRNHEEN